MLLKQSKYVFILLLTSIDIVSKDILFKLGNRHINSFISIQPVINHGSSFGIFEEIPGYSYIIAIIGIIIIIILRKTNSYFFILLCSGTLGNLYDRIVYCGVRDFIKTPLFTFNLADIYLTGAFFILLNIIIKNETQGET